MIKLNHTFEISEQAFNLLKDIERAGYAEYRDPEVETIEEFRKNVGYTDHFLEEQYLRRNFGGTYHLAEELLMSRLIEADAMSWNVTFVVNELGKKMIEQNS